jgi:hypothetical protein
VADDIERINDRFLASGTNYVIIGPGRWGSSDPWLGVPVKWPHLSAARVIVEVALKNYRVDPSQGTHFFQNLTSFGVGYFTIDTNRPGEAACCARISLMPCPPWRRLHYVRTREIRASAENHDDGKKQEGVGDL